MGRNQVGFGTKIHVRVEGGGKPMVLLLTAGQRHEQTVFELLMEQGAVKRPGKGRPRIRPDRVAGDKWYNSRKFRRIATRSEKRAVNSLAMRTIAAITFWL